MDEDNSPIQATVETVTRLPTAEEVEKRLLDKKELSAEEVEKIALETHRDFTGDPMAQAATLYGLYMPKFLAGLPTLSHRQLLRLIKALIQAPFWETIPKFKNKDEENMFMVGDRLLQAKLVMIAQQFADYQTKPKGENENDGTENKQVETNSNRSSEET